MADGLPQVTLLPPSGKKRRRPALSCEQCRRRKVRCDRLSPCTTCVQAGNRECSYASLPSRAPVSGSTSVTSASALPAGPGGPGVLPPRTSDVSELSPEATSSGTSSRIPTSGSRSLSEWREERLFPPENIWVNNADAERRLDPNMLVDRIRQLEWQVESFERRQSSASLGCPHKDTTVPMKGMLQKTRFLGPSHWIHACVLVCRPFLLYNTYCFSFVYSSNSFSVSP